MAFEDGVALNMGSVGAQHLWIIASGGIIVVSHGAHDSKANVLTAHCRSLHITLVFLSTTCTSTRSRNIPAPGLPQLPPIGWSHPTSGAIRRMISWSYTTNTGQSYEHRPMDCHTSTLPSGRRSTGTRRANLSCPKMKSTFLA